MIEPIIDYCIFEDVPKEQSRIYRNVLIIMGKEFADQFTYERGMHNGSDNHHSIVPDPISKLG